MNRLMMGALILTMIFCVTLWGCGEGGSSGSNSASTPSTGNSSTGQNTSTSSTGSSSTGQNGGSATTASYTITSLGPVTATAINASGQTTGYVTNSSGVSALILGAPDGYVVNEGVNGEYGYTSSCYGVGINASGEIAGYEIVNSGFRSVRKRRKSCRHLRDQPHRQYRRPVERSV